MTGSPVLLGPHTGGRDLSALPSHLHVLWVCAGPARSPVCGASARATKQTSGRGPCAPCPSILATMSPTACAHACSDLAISLRMWPQGVPCLPVHRRCVDAKSLKGSHSHNKFKMDVPVGLAQGGGVYGFFAGYLWQTTPLSSVFLPAKWA